MYLGVKADWKIPAELQGVPYSFNRADLRHATDIVYGPAMAIEDHLALRQTLAPMYYCATLERLVRKIGYMKDADNIQAAEKAEANGKPFIVYLGCPARAQLPAELHGIPYGCGKEDLPNATHVVIGPYISDTECGASNKSGLPSYNWCGISVLIDDIKSWQQMYDRAAQQSAAEAPAEGDTVTNAEGGRQSYIGARFDLLPPDATLAVAEVLHGGAEKYGEENWRKIAKRDHINHAIAHLFAFLRNGGRGEEPDLRHAACRVMFALDLDEIDNELEEIF